MIARIDELFLIEPGSIAKCNMYLGVKVSNMVFPNGVIAWVFITSKYAQEACKNVTYYL